MKTTTIPMTLALCAILALAVPVQAAPDPLPSGTGVEGECVVLYSFPDAGYAVCVDKDGSSGCHVYTVEQTIAGPRTNCVVA